MNNEIHFLVKKVGNTWDAETIDGTGLRVLACPTRELAIVEARALAHRHCKTMGKATPKVTIDFYTEKKDES